MQKSYRVQSASCAVEAQGKSSPPPRDSRAPHPHLTTLRPGPPRRAGRGAAHGHRTAGAAGDGQGCAGGRGQGRVYSQASRPRGAHSFPLFPSWGSSFGMCTFGGRLGVSRQARGLGFLGYFFCTTESNARLASQHLGEAAAGTHCHVHFGRGRLGLASQRTHGCAIQFLPSHGTQLELHAALRCAAA